MSAQPTIAGSIARYLGFTLIILGASGLAVGYMGWKDAVTREAALVDPGKRSNVNAVAPAKGSVRITATQPTRRTTGSVARPRRTARRATTAPYRPATVRQIATAAPAKVNVVLTAPSRTIATMRRTMAWGGGSLLVGLVLVGFSLYEKPPQRPRSGADEMLNEPLPF